MTGLGGGPGDDAGPATVRVGPAPPLGEPGIHLADPHALLCGYLDHYRDTLLRKADGLTEEELRGSRLPSGWSPLELVRHLTHVERRWLCWGFRAEPVADPWGDRGPDDRWQVPAGTAAAEVFADFRAQCETSRAVVEGVPLEARARTGGRFATEAEAPTLAWTLFHLLQEYARHVGQLDVVRELADGAVGE